MRGRRKDFEPEINMINSRKRKDILVTQVYIVRITRTMGWVPVEQNLSF